MQNWIRTFRIIAGNKGETGLEISDDGSGTALHVSFSVEKTRSTTSNTCKLNIWNLNDAHKGALKKRGCVVELRAGYNGNNAPIFMGRTRSAIESMDGADRMIELELYDGWKAFVTTSSVSFSGVVPCITVANKFISDMGVSASVFTDTAKKIMSETKYDNGFSFIGRSKDGFGAVCDKCGLKWSIQNEVLQVYTSGEPINRNVYVLNADSGLIGMPKKTTQNGSSGGGCTIGSDTVTYDGYEYWSYDTGYEVEYFLNGSIGVGDYVKLEAKGISEYLRVQKISISGDNVSGDWVCKASLLKPNYYNSLYNSTGITITSEGYTI